MAVSGLSQIEALKRQVNGSIDGIQKAIELVPFWDDLNSGWSFELTTPIGYLLALARALDIMDGVKDFLAKTISWSLPAIELGVKGVLLTNLTKCLSCSTNPFIPNEFRTMYYKSTFNMQPPSLEFKENENYDKNRQQSSDGDGDGKKEHKYKFVYNHGEYSFEQVPVFGPGIKIPVASIDYDNMLSRNPFAKWNKLTEFVDYSELYFGITKTIVNDEGKEEKVKISPFLLARAEDCNAYLWFVKNRGYFKDCLNVDSVSDVCTKQDAHLMEYVDVESGTVGGKCEHITNGTGVRYADSLSLSIAADVELDNSGKATSFKLLPVSSNSHDTNKPSINWYYNPKLAWTSNLTELSKKERDYSLDRPIYSLTYDNNEFTFKILPKPLLHTSIYIHKGQEETMLDGGVVKAEKAWYEHPTRIRKILFDAQGRPQTKEKNGGRFTVSPRIDSGGKIVRLKESEDGHQYIYRLYKAKDVFSGDANPADTGEPEVVLYYDAYKSKYALKKYYPDQHLCKFDPISDKELSEYLYECYPGLTIYQFNYDYIMGMRLFDANVILTKLMDSLFNLNVGVKVSAEQIAAREEIREMVERVINTSEVTDNCYFTFDNDKVNQMMEDAEAKRNGTYTFMGNGVLDEESRKAIQDALSAVSSSGNKIEEKANIDTVMSAGVGAATKFVGAETKYGAEAFFLEKLTIELIEQIVLNALMTPKVAMLLQVNGQFMGKPASGTVDFKSMFKQLQTLIYSMIKEIVQMLLEELFNLLMSKLYELLQAFGTAVIAEYLNFYAELIKEIITQCGFRIGSGPNNSGIDQVNYADIDARSNTPPTDNC